ncbi:MAG: L-threonylcarbamoyladenylate synthase [Coriobacteriia bacterium]|nr:L-threonylcarbamoyladenylate synthase [Coriobacteriia bacterium]
MGELYRYNQANQDELIAAIAARLQKGELGVLPTDTVYGIAALVSYPDAVDRIFSIKKRSAEQKLPWLLADIEDLESYALDIPDYAFVLAQQFFPGALSLVLRAKPHIHQKLLQEDQSLAFRIPDANFVRQIIRASGFPLACTSANTHGKPSATSFEDLEARICDHADFVVDGGLSHHQQASTIVSCLNDRPEFLRIGAISKEEILSALDVHE